MELEYTLEKITNVAQKFIAELDQHKIVLLYGEMGVGKTTFVQAVCKALGIEENISSPTFSIINQYESTTGNIIYHVDMYRVKDEVEAIHAGVEEILFSDRLCFVEWPALILNLLDGAFLKVDIILLDERRRRITTKVVE